MSPDWDYGPHSLAGHQLKQNSVDGLVQHNWPVQNTSLQIWEEQMVVKWVHNHTTVYIFISNPDNRQYEEEVTLIQQYTESTYTNSKHSNICNWKHLKSNFKNKDIPGIHWLHILHRKSRGEPSSVIYDAYCLDLINWLNTWSSSLHQVLWVSWLVIHCWRCAGRCARPL